MNLIYKKSFLITLLFLLVFPPLLYASDLKIDLSVDKKEVGLDDYLRLTVKVSSDSISSMPNAVISGLEEFETLGKSSGTQVSIVNMDMKRSYTTTYTLRPRSSGKTVNLKASVKSGSKTFFSNGVDVKLVKSTAGQGQQNSGRQSGQNQNPFGNFGQSPFGNFARNPLSLFNRGFQRGYKKDDFILQATVSSPNVYVGEELIYTLSFYRAVQIMSQINYDFPNTKGFWKETIADDKREEASSQTIAGREYIVVKIPLILYPLTDGKIKLGKSKIAFQPDAFSGKISLESNSFEINVLPLPADGKPADFSGLVGDYSITSTIDKTEVIAGKPVTLEVNVTGRGNVHAIEEPKRPDLSGFEVYEPETAENISKSPKGSSGKKSYKYIIIPSEEGKIDVGGFSINWFDPKTKTYKEAKTKKVTISVLPSKQMKRANRNDDKKSVDEKKEPPKKKHFSFSIAGLILIAIALLMLKIFVPKKKKAEKKLEPELSLSEQAEVQLSEAEERLRKGDADGFYLKIDGALRELICEKKNISQDEPIIDAIKAKLEIEDSPLLQMALELFRKSDTMRYGPVIASKEEMEEAYQSAKEILDNLS